MPVVNLDLVHDHASDDDRDEVGVKSRRRRRMAVKLTSIESSAPPVTISIRDMPGTGRMARAPAGPGPGFKLGQLECQWATSAAVAP